MTIWCSVKKTYIIIKELFIVLHTRLNGSYERLWAGQLCEAVVDLSGTIAVRWSLKGAESPQQPEDSQTQHTPNGTRLSELSLELKERCAISCCVHSASTGERGSRR